MRLAVCTLSAVLLSGCSSKYVYVPESRDDPEITFGDRFGGGAIYSPARNFSINITDTNKCSDYKYVGVLSNNWMGIGEETIVVSVPKGKKISMIGTYNYSTGSSNSHCEVGPVSFEPESSQHYSIDITTLLNYCRISILEILPNGVHSKVPVSQKKEEECLEGT